MTLDVEAKNPNAALRSRLALRTQYGADFIGSLHMGFQMTPLVVSPGVAAKFQLNDSDFEYLLRQEISFACESRRWITRPLLASIASGRRGVYGVPKEWRNVLRTNGVPIAEARSKLLWIGRIVSNFARGVMSSLLLLRRSWQKDERARSRGDLGRWAYFDSLGRDNLPQGAEDNSRTDLVSWFEQRTDALIDIETCVSRAKPVDPKSSEGRMIREYRFPIPLPSSWTACLRLVLSQWALLARSLILGSGGNWHLMYMSRGLCDLLSFTRSSKQSRPTLVAYNTSSARVRPPWTIAAHSEGCRILCYHYATNMDTILPSSATASQSQSTWTPWALSWWPEVWVWDSTQKRFLEQVTERESKYIEVGPVLFVSTRSRFDLQKLPQIALFDVTPQTWEWLALVAENYPYYTPTTCREFVELTVEVANSIGLGVLIKSKRTPGSSADTSYLNALKRLSQRANVQILSPDVGVEELIKQTLASVSIPFSSPAVLARYMQRPSSYFDPTGAVDREHPAGRGIPIYSDAGDLGSWLESLVTVQGS